MFNARKLTMGNKKTSVSVDRDFILAKVDNRIFGSFLEHLGRAVYTGIYQPDHPSADEDGFRKDVMALVSALGISIIRYPGGNYVSNFFWEDSVGPVEQRPTRLDLAWRSIEPNIVGLHEFYGWVKKIGAQPLMAINMGTRGIADACNLLEYCNGEEGSKYSDLRISHGVREPLYIKTWCLGNEMDGPWQIGHKSAEEYGKLARETAKAMKQIDSNIELVCCGSSNSNMPTFPDWEATTLDYVYDYVDYISMHQYYGNEQDDTEDFLAVSVDMDNFIKSVIATCDYIKAKHRSNKTMFICFDEWNVWFHSKKHDEDLMKNKPWGRVPPLLEDVYTFEDALVVAMLLMTLLRHADRVKIACLAQLVNVVAPIMTDPKGKAWRQTIYYPVLHLSKYGRGEVLEAFVKATSHATKSFTEVPDIEVLVTHDEEAGHLAIFAVNRDLHEMIDFSCHLRGFEEYRVVEHICMHVDDMKTTNSVERELVTPYTCKDWNYQNGNLEVPLQYASWNVIRLKR